MIHNQLILLDNNRKIKADSCLRKLKMDIIKWISDNLLGHKLRWLSNMSREYNYLCFAHTKPKLNDYQSMFRVQVTREAPSNTSKSGFRLHMLFVPHVHVLFPYSLFYFWSSFFEWLIRYNLNNVICSVWDQPLDQMHVQSIPWYENAEQSPNQEWLVCTLLLSAKREKKSHTQLSSSLSWSQHQPRHRTHFS